MKKISTLILTIILSVTLVWQPVRAESDDGRLTSYPHEEVDFTALEYERPNTEDLRELIESLSELCGDISNLELVQTAIDALEQELVKVLDMSVLSDHLYRNNPSDNELYLENTYINEELQDLFQLYKEALKDVLLSPCKDAAYTYYSLQDAESIIASESLTDKERELMHNSNALCQEWYMETSGNKQKIGDIYFRLVKNNNELASLLGYDNYLDYTYSVSYKRDYTPKDAMDTCESVRNGLKEYRNLLTAYQSLWMYNAVDSVFSEDMEKLIGEYIGKMAPEFVESFEYMLNTNSLEILPEDGTINSYTSVLVTYGMPFICMNEGNYRIDTVRTLVHEFGHYNAYYWRDLLADGSYNLDLEETFSQGLELLFADYFEELIGDAGESAERNMVGRLLRAIYDACMVSETEYVAYTGDFESVDEFIKALDDVGKKYYPESISLWYLIPHIIETPGYYISYSISAINALEIYSLSQEDYEKAVDAYIDLIKYAPLSYKEAFEKSGLTPVWTSEKMNTLLKKLIHMFLDRDDPVIDGVEDGAVYDSPVSISLKDISGLRITVSKDGKAYTEPSRDFELGKESGDYTIKVTDGFGNSSAVSFTVEPAPFTVSVTDDGAGKHLLSWKNVAGATGYKVYGGPVGGKVKLLGTVDKDTLEFVNKKADDRVWKYYVKAIKTENGKNTLISKTPVILMAGAGNEEYTNAVKVQIKQGESLSLTIGEKKKLKVKTTLADKTKKLFSAKSIKSVRYISTDTKVAKVSKSGKITAVGKGTCYIYCISENGLTDRIKLSVSE